MSLHERFLVPSTPDFAVDWDSIDARFDWIRAMKGTLQDPLHHAEGDVWIHTRLVAEAMARLDAFRGLDADRRAIAFVSALLHDVAKPTSTQVGEDGRVTAKGHSTKGAALARRMLLGALLFAGCGSDGESEFKDGNGGGAWANGGGTGFVNGEGSGAGNGSNGNGNSGTPGEVGNVDPNAACATASDGAVMQPISLVFMIDRSGSMKEEDDISTIDVRWNPVKNGLKTFFGDPNSRNTSASISFFPIVTGSGKDAETSCSSADYKNAVVGMTELPNANAFSTAFDKGPGGSTPSEPALKGALDAARDAKASGKNVAVVLATDGEPNGCSSDPSGVESIAADGLKDGIKTYVVGVGPNTGNLNGFADKGGTGTAIMIPTNNSAQVSADLIKAIGQIASSLLGCNYGLPTPLAGQTLNVNAVNVNYTPPGAAATTLPYSADCSNPNGWHYDSTTAPKEVVLCTNACNTAKSAVGAKLDIIFGCATAVPPGGVDPNGNVR